LPVAWYVSFAWSYERESALMVTPPDFHRQRDTQEQEGNKKYDAQKYHGIPIQKRRVTGYAFPWIAAEASSGQADAREKLLPAKRLKSFAAESPFHFTDGENGAAGDDDIVTTCRLPCRRQTGGNRPRIEARDTPCVADTREFL